METGEHDRTHRAKTDFLRSPVQRRFGGGAAAVRAALGWYSANPEQFDFDSMGPVFGGARVVDCGDVAGDLHDGAANRTNIEAAVRSIRKRGAVPLLLGGDDSVPIPLFRA